MASISNKIELPVWEGRRGEREGRELCGLSAFQERPLIFQGTVRLDQRIQVESEPEQVKQFSFLCLDFFTCESPGLNELDE